MPFTFSHPAIVLPLAYLPSRWVSLTGLIIGSLTPDFEYFIRMKVVSNFSHTIGGLFYFDIPFGILLTFIFHLIVKDSLINNLPRFLKSRAMLLKNLNWNSYFRSNWWIVVISVGVGAASHIFWDAFTHDKGYFVQQLTSIRENLVVFRMELPIYKVFQHLSTIIGGLVIVYALCQLPTTSVINHTPNFSYWFTVVTIALVIVVIRTSVGIDLRFIGHLLVSGISAVLVSLMLTPLFFKIK